MYRSRIAGGGAVRLAAAAARGGLLAAALFACRGSARPEPGSPPPATLSPATYVDGSWVVDPRDPGPSLPPTGRSLFDHLTADREGGSHAVPFPLAALLARIEEQVERPAQGPALKRVLIPRGRSLQRDAGAPDFFKFPRVVAAVDAEPLAPPGRSGMLLKDRLYVGYHEKAAVLEVISYNEAAGRFEFQVVKDYRPGGTPRVFYANRALCMACHQNGGPIFARPLWDETNANSGIAALLGEQRRDFYGIPVGQGVDVPYEVDAATDRANRFSAYQLLWQDGCGPDADPGAAACRADLFVLALQYRLNGSVGLDRQGARFRRTLGERLPKRWAERWSKGLLLPNPDIPNRVPLRPPPEATASFRVPATLAPAAQTELLELVRLTDVPSAFEPLNPRPPLDVLEPERGLPQLAAGLSEFLAESDLRRLEALLAAPDPSGAARAAPLASRCALESSTVDDGTTRVSFECGAEPAAAGASPADFALTGRLYLAGTRVVRGSIDGVAVGGRDELPALTVQGGSASLEGQERRARFTVAQRSNGRPARRANGRRVEGLTLAWPQGSEVSSPGRAEMETRDDFARVEAAVEAMVAARGSDAFAFRPFRRASLLPALESRLGAPPLDWCCTAEAGLPPPALEEHTAGGERGPSGDARMQTLERYCAQCHETADRFPPNFLHGDAARVQANLARCGERILFRLGMWGVPGEARLKTPMPPDSFLTSLHVSREQWPEHPDLKVLQDYVAEVVRTQTGRVPSLDELSARGYLNLQTCLAEAPPRGGGAGRPQ